jgi:succinate dehydrogenase/fumarate reductase flavoprotein subunit
LGASLRWDEEADVVIVGTGFSGLAAAIIAAVNSSLTNAFT